MVKWVKPTSDMMPARPEMAARLGNTAQAMKRAAVWLGMKLVLVRIQRSKQQWLGWSTALTASSFASAGARATTEMALQAAVGQAKGTSGFPSLARI